MSIISINNLTCRYGDFTAVKDLSLSVQPGEIFGFLGPNGAGKTTTLRTMMDFIRPVSGTISIFGMDSRQDSVAIRKKIGYLSSELVLWENWTGQEYIKWLENLRGIQMMGVAQRLAERLDFDLSRSLHGMSTGMKRKMGLIAILAHEPELLILDEPTIGLDPLMQHAFKELMLEVKADGRTVFLSSHDLKEVETICDHVAIIRDGQLQTIENVANLTRLNFRWLKVRFNNGALPAENFSAIKGITDISHTNGELKMRISGEVSIDTVIKELAKFKVDDLSFEHPSLEEIFLTYYGKEA